jgi:hypothetical protein
MGENLNGDAIFDMDPEGAWNSTRDTSGGSYMDSARASEKKDECPEPEPPLPAHTDACKTWVGVTCDKC